MFVFKISEFKSYAGIKIIFKILSNFQTITPYLIHFKAKIITSQEQSFSKFHLIKIKKWDIK